MQYTTGPTAGDTLLAQFGFGGRGDVIDAQGATLGTPFVDPRWVYSRDLTSAQVGGGNDTIYGNGGEDILIGGAGNDAIDGGSADDLIFGDAVQLQRRDVRPGVTGDITNLRFQALTGTQIYSTANATLGQALNNGTAQSYRDGDGLSVPTTRPTGPSTRSSTCTSRPPSRRHRRGADYGNDYIAGGPADDKIFGQLGNDVIQGDGSIDPVRDAATTLACLTTARSARQLELRAARRRLPRLRRQPPDQPVRGQPGRHRRQRLHRGRRRQRRHLRQPGPGRHHRRQLEPVHARRRRRSGPTRRT